MIAGPTQFELLKEKYAKLHTLQEESYGYTITGDLDLIDPINGKLWETYTVKIEVVTFLLLPSVYEISNKIPKESDRHINGDGSCCLSPQVEQALILGNNYTLVDYVDKLVIPFLAAQKLFELGEGWINGEYSHQIEGVVEYYQEKLKTKNISIILQCLRHLTDLSEQITGESCICGNGKRFGECHKILIDQFSQVNPELLSDDIILIESYLNNTIV